MQQNKYMHQHSVYTQIKQFIIWCGCCFFHKKYPGSVKLPNYQYFQTPPENLSFYVINPHLAASQATINASAVTADTEPYKCLYYYYYYYTS